MASNTPRLNLYKKDPVADANTTFNITTMLNENWDRIDQNVELSSVAKKRQIENIGYGVQTGLNVTAQSPASMTVDIQPGVIYMPDGERFEFSTVKSIAVAASDVTSPRKDIIYVSAAGVIEYLDGTPAVAPVEPILPTGALQLCTIDVPAGDTAIEQTQITDSRVMKKDLKALEQELVAHSADYGKHPADGGTTGGTSTAYTCSSNPAPTALVDKIGVVITAHVDSGANPTLNWNGLGAKPIKKPNGNAAVLKAGGIYTLRYSAASGNFILQGEGGEYGTAGAPQVLEGYTVGTENGVIPGTMPNKAGMTQAASWSNPSGSTTVNVPIPVNGYYNTSSILQLSEPDLIPSNIRQGINIFGVVGTLIEGKRWASGTTTLNNSTKTTITGLSFTPSIIIVRYNNTSLGTDVWAIYISTAYTGLANNKKFWVPVDGGTPDVAYGNNNTLAPQNGGFDIFPPSTGTTNRAAYWLAIE